MFRPGNLGHLGRLGLVAASQPSLVARALAILARYGSAANLYLPGVGAINGITAGNWLDTVGGTAATVDGAVGAVVNARGGANLTQATTANQPILRRGLVNQLTQSDFQNGVTDAPTRGGLVTASTLAGYGGAIAFGHDGATASYAYKNFSATVGVAYTLAVVVRMDDGNAPTFGHQSIDGNSNSFALVSKSDGVNPQTYTVVAQSDGTYIVCATHTNGTTGVSNFGVVKYATNSSRTFKVTRYGLFTGTVTAQQIIDSGGIPITTTAPASSTSGPFAWQFDGSNDNLTSTITPGNAGFFCLGARFIDSGTVRTLVGAGAGGPSEPGVWLNRNIDGNLALIGGNGAGRDIAVAACPSGSTFVASCGWAASSMFVGVNGTETNVAKTRVFTSSNTINLGVLTGTTNPMLGTISGGAIIMPTVLPTVSERATLRQFIASLSGVTL